MRKGESTSNRLWAIQLNSIKRKFRRMKAFARYKNEIWSMDLAYVDNLAME